LSCEQAFQSASALKSHCNKNKTHLAKLTQARKTKKAAARILGTGDGIPHDHEIFRMRPSGVPSSKKRQLPPPATTVTYDDDEDDEDNEILVAPPSKFRSSFINNYFTSNDGAATTTQTPTVSDTSPATYIDDEDDETPVARPSSFRSSFIDNYFFSCNDGATPTTQTPTASNTSPVTYSVDEETTKAEDLPRVAIKFRSSFINNYVSFSNDGGDDATTTDHTPERSDTIFATPVPRAGRSGHSSTVNSTVNSTIFNFFQPQK
jgi:hypothetical protein